VTGDEMAMGVPLEDIAHIVQVALTPVFLLSGIASLLNVINARQGRLADAADDLHQQLLAAEGVQAAALCERLLRMRRRLQVIDAARACGAFAAICICAATFALFLGALRNTAVATALFLLFGASVLGTMICLLGFLAEVLMSWNRHAPLPDRDA
jgi:hypothetical protein